ncbi:MAG: CbiX/SirB N-terminal domain-containing protein, partial [Desulfobacteraceae bacterium]
SLPFKQISLGLTLRQSGSGSHVTKDIPEILSKIKARHPRIKITATRHLGVAEGVKELILEEVANQ